MNYLLALLITCKPLKELLGSGRFRTVIDNNFHYQLIYLISYFFNYLIHSLEIKWKETVKDGNYNSPEPEPVSFNCLFCPNKPQRYLLFCHRIRRKTGNSHVWEAWSEFQMAFLFFLHFCLKNQERNHDCQKSCCIISWPLSNQLTDWSLQLEKNPSSSCSRPLFSSANSLFQSSMDHF